MPLGGLPALAKTCDDYRIDSRSMFTSGSVLGFSRTQPRVAIGWESVKYPAGTGGFYASPFAFTSTYNIAAVGSGLRNGTTPAPGRKGAICHNITLLNVAGTYQAPARTATHIHEAARGASGPPRLAFPNPVGDDKKRVGVGCLTGPFTTGFEWIEENPAGFFADSHTNLFSFGVVRGQLA
ncbi:uncharacterized protein K444DRAFT_639931 [Hyaloscypha bicolor E]|uniref:Uncharacterized protein n=1 Tax=Hyaloscypha bicolor E TaxID=1095630 RepID=A0A2J6TSC0_9HELO|nr:uncharacterized protein K444DRAFT_639931 [Hyaloscypha bicolor E]PMD65919.1 hypothetical protein K444DRAFT_639931 [Hyaloscypha bicolor E]